MSEITYTTEETVELQPMDAVSAATTPEETIAALLKENQELLLELKALEEELNAEMTEHGETAAKLNHVETMLLALYQLYSKGRFKGLTISVGIDELNAAVKTAEQRYRVGVERQRIVNEKLAALPIGNLTHSPYPLYEGHEQIAWNNGLVGDSRTQSLAIAAAASHAAYLEDK